MGKRRRKRKKAAPVERASLITPEEIDELMRKGAESARELAKQIEPVFRLTAAQRNLVLR